jgi:hypothetical protein
LSEAKLRTSLLPEEFNFQNGDFMIHLVAAVQSVNLIFLCNLWLMAAFA